MQDIVEPVQETNMVKYRIMVPFGVSDDQDRSRSLYSKRNQFMIVDGSLFTGTWCKMASSSRPSSRQKLIP